MIKMNKFVIQTTGHVVVQITQIGYLETRCGERQNDEMMSYVDGGYIQEYLELKNN